MCIYVKLLGKNQEVQKPTFCSPYKLRSKVNGAEVSDGHFGTGAEVSSCRSVRTPLIRPLACAFIRVFQFSLPKGPKLCIEQYINSQ